MGVPEGGGGGGGGGKRGLAKLRQGGGTREHRERGAIAGAAGVTVPITGAEDGLKW
eukprot:COSAG06_NODE_15255_length_1085_cov_25.292089_1_plen_55_part_10